MADPLEFADAVLGAVLDALAPLAAAARDEGVLLELLKELGWLLPEEHVDPSSVTSLGAVAAAVSDATAAMDSYRASGKPDPATLASLAADIVSLLTRLQQLDTATLPTGLPEPFSRRSFWTAMASELPGFLLAGYLRRENPTLLLVMRISGVLDQVVAQLDGNRVDGQLVDVLRWDRLAKLVSDPRSLMSDVYGWGGTFLFESFFQRLEQSLVALGLPAFRANPGQEMLDRHYGVGTTAPNGIVKLRVPLHQGTDSRPFTELGLDAFPVPASLGSSSPAGLLISPYSSAALPAQTVLSDDAILNFSGTLDGSGATGGIIIPGSVNLFVDGPALTGDLTAELAFTPNSPYVLIGNPSSTGVSVGTAALGFKLRTADATISEGLVLVRLSALKISVDFSQGDGFISTISGELKGATQFDLTVAWSSNRGLYFDGGGALQRTLPLHLSLGPMEVHWIDLRVGADGNDILLSGAITASLALGPIGASVEGIGVALRLTPEPSATFFGLTPRFAFKPPDGLGISIDAGSVAGGGFISFDDVKKEYAGFLDICIAEIVQVKFIAILDTKLPDGSNGYSFIFIIFLELPPIQLGYGFTLNGVGGVAGINRTMSTTGLQTGLYNHTLECVINPPHTIADAPKVISAVSSFFPLALGRYVFGPIVAIGWETFIQLTVGVILEVPDPIRLALLGIVDVALPSIEDPDEAVVLLHVLVLGTLDFGTKKLAVDGSMYGSRILEFPILGDFALRTSWGANPSSLFSMGGLNPHFNTSGLDVPQLHRMAISIGDGDNPQISANSYLALTSNTIQFGADIEARVSKDGFKVHGYLGFDVLIFVAPPTISFEFDFAAGFDVSYKGENLAGVTLTGTLTGTTPWHIHGDATLHLLCFSVSKSVDKTWGDTITPQLPPEAILPDLLPALADPCNWSAALPDGTTQAATLNTPKSDPKTVIVHPMGTLTVREKVVPLDLQISHYKSGIPSDGNYFSIGDVLINGSKVSKDAFQDYFAAGQFIDLSDADKLSRSSFQQYDAGVKVASANICSGADSPRTVAYDEFYIDDPISPIRLSSVYQMPSNAYVRLCGQGAGFQSALKNTGFNKYKTGPSTPAATTKDPSYVVASVDDLSVRTDITGAKAMTYYQARTALGSHLARNPQDVGNLQILPAHEATP